MKKILLIATLSLGVGLMSADPSLAVHKNYDNALTCGNCHTMHNSQGGIEFPESITGGSLILLRGPINTRAEIHLFCLQCHASNGIQAGKVFGTDDHPAPKVFIDAAGGAGNGAIIGTTGTLNLSKIGAGGDFSGEMDTNWVAATTASDLGLGRGHSLGFTDVLPPGAAAGDGILANFSCTSCHDPHGAYDADTPTVNKYRNLRMSPTGSGNTVDLNDHITSYVGDQTGSKIDFIPEETGGAVGPSFRVWPLYDVDPDTGTLAGDGSDTLITNTYAVTAGLNATDGISNWCATCHDNWHESYGTESNRAGADWRRHPVDNPLTGDGTNESGAGVTIIDTVAGYPFTSVTALPVAPTTTGFGVAYLPSTGNTDDYKVFCLSCHFAHGGPYYDNLRWDYTSGVTAGDQDGNSIGEKVGCQQCHNR